MFVRSNEKNYLCLFVDYIYIYIYIYKEHELRKLDVHITRNSSLICSSTIEGKKKRALRLSFVFKKNSSLVSSSIVLHMELEFTKLEFHVTFFH